MESEACYACGATLSTSVEWCGQCYAPRGRAANTVGTTATATMTRPVPTAQPLPPQLVKTRWRKTQTTFGPVGRIIATLALVLPFIGLVIVGILTGGLELGGAVLWGVVVMPWGLRDVWRAGQLPVK